MNRSELQAHYARPDAEVLSDPRADEVHGRLLELLEQGELRAAEPDGQGGWHTHVWVKRAILLGFRRTAVVPHGQGFWDKSAYPPRQLGEGDGVRLVPGGSAVRRGAHLAKGVVVMPPAYVNVGAYVGAGTMIDSHALVGSCAQIGARVHLSAGAQVGGVLEPQGARPVVIEDDVFVGGLAGVFEGVWVRAGAVLGAGCVLAAATPIFDLVHQREWRGEVPPRAVVLQASRPAPGEYATARGLSIAAAVIVKYRDERTDAATALESALR